VYEGPRPSGDSDRDVVRGPEAGGTRSEGPLMRVGVCRREAGEAGGVRCTAGVPSKFKAVFSGFIASLWVTECEG
jgi:hypothetical protein